MTETGLNGAIGIPSGLNRIKIRRSVTDPLSSSSSSPRPPLVDHIMKDRDKRHPKIRGRKHGSSGLSKGKKIARWFTSYLAKDSHQMSNDNHPNTAANTLEIKMVDKKGVQGNMHSNGKESSEEIPDTRRPPPGFKSFSHELGPKGGIRPFSSRAHSYDDLKEMLGSLRSRFDAAKVVVNAELANFVHDVEEVFGEECSSPPKGLNEARDLLFLAQKCTKMASSELREECGGIVQDLADKRQQCQAGTIKQLYTRLLFILTRCTRLLQFEKDNEPIDENSLHKFKRCLESIPCVEMNWMGKPEQPPNSDLKDTSGKKGSSISPVHEFMVVKSQNRVATNLRKDSIALKQKSILRSSQINVESSETSITVHGPDDVEPLPGDKVFSEYQNAKGQVIPQVEDSSPGNSLPKQTCSLLHERDASFDGSDSVICRICEEVVPTSHLESHSYVCAYAEKCDLKCLDVDERLSKLADVLEQIVDSHSSSQHASCGSPDIARMQTANAAGSGGQSPKMIEWHSKGVEGMFEDLHEMDTAFIDEPHLGSSSNLKSYLGMKLGHQGGPSSTGSMTSMSSNNTPRASHFDLYWLEQNNAAELEEVHQMIELVDIARQVAITNVTKEGGSDYLLACMHDLQDILEHSRIKGLVVDTFGSRIENILREKYLLACESMDDKSPSTRRYKDGDGCLMDSPSQSSGVSTPLHPAHRDRISIDDFEILKPISRGAFGKVFLARKRTTGDLFAIKVLKKLDMIRKNDIERILAERNILITVRNPFVVRFFYSFTCRDNLYLVMEYLNGGDLYSLLKNVGSLEEDVARTYVAELVLALEYLHSLGIVHRDLKPDNILIAHDGHIKLTDFGLSKIGLINSTDNLSGSETNSSNLPEVDDLSSSFENTDQQTEERFQHSAVGTPDYLAPEILLGTEHGYAADWWSVGIILFELITGIPPFSAESPEMIFDNILNKKMPWPSVPDDMSYEAQDLINRFLNLDPSRRLGANGAPEVVTLAINIVKTHPFFRGVNWNTLALQKAAFIPSPENPADTSYFMSRYPQASNRISEDESYGDSSSDTTNSCSKSGIEMDECGDLADFNSSSFDLSMINFSFKNLSQLAAINYDVLMQRDPSSCSSPSRGTDL